MNSKNLTFKGSFSDLKSEAQDDKKGLNPSRSKIFLFCCIFFIIGIAVASFLPDKIIRQEILWFLLLVISLVFIILFRQNKIIHLASLAGLFLFLGIWRYSLSLPTNGADKIWFYNGSEVKVRAVIDREPDVRRNFIKYTVETLQKTSDNLKRGRTFKDVSGKILISADLYPAYNYGDELEIKCELQSPESINDFAYDKYLARYDIYSICYYPEIKKVDSKNFSSWRNFIFGNIFSLKKKLSAKISQGMNEPEASLARGIVLGERANIDQKINDDFSRTGLTHLIAISGMNISILAVLAMEFLIYVGLWRQQAFFATVLFLVVYLILIGLPASAVRAGVMGVLVLYALKIGRLNKITNSLVFVGALMIFFNPKILRADVGFQLSFLAVLGISYAYPEINKWFAEKHWKNLGIIRDVLSVTIAAQIFTLPIMAANFSMISLISPLANLATVWTMPIVMVAAMAALPLSFLMPEISYLFFLPAQILLKYVVYVSGLLAKIPYAYAQPNFKGAEWIWILYYMVIIFLMTRKRLVLK